MRVLINCLHVYSGGTKTYVQNMVRELGQFGQEHEFILLHSKWQEELMGSLPNNFTREIHGPIKRRVPKKIVWENLFLGNLAKRLSVDVVYSLTPATALYIGVPHVISVDNPNPFEPVDRASVAYYIRNALLRAVTQLQGIFADRLIFLSEYARDAALEKISVPPDKCLVNYWGVGEHFLEERGETRVESSLGCGPHILAVSTIKMHKNYPNLVKAFSLLCEDESFGHDLMIVGAPRSSKVIDELDRIIEETAISHRVRMVGEVPNEDLPPIYQAADLYVMPSYLETFGIPLVEAMASGTPVCAAKTSAIPEVAGEAAHYFVPTRPKDIAAAMREVLEDEQLRSTLIQNGLKRARRFTWKQSATNLIEILRDLTPKNWTPQ